MGAPAKAETATAPKEDAAAAAAKKEDEEEDDAGPAARRFKPKAGAKSNAPAKVKGRPGGNKKMAAVAAPDDGHSEESH